LLPPAHHRWSKTSDVNCQIEHKFEHLLTTPNNNISDFIPASYFCVCEYVSFGAKKRHLREILLHFLGVKKSTVELHRFLVGAYGEATITETTCRNWFPRFKSGDLDVKDKERARRTKLVEDAELEVLLDENPYQTQEELVESLEITPSIA